MQFLIDIHTHNFLDSAESLHLLNVFAQDLPLLADLLPINQKVSVGLHPWHIQKVDESQQTAQMIEKIANMAIQTNVFAIGETGLDKLIKTDFVLQKNIFRQHIAISETCQKPLIIHSLKTYNEIMVTRKETGAKQAWVIHGFNANELIAKQLIACGCYLSFGHLLLNPQTKASQVFAKLPLASCFLETDDKQIRLAEVYGQAAQLRKMSVEALASQLYQNFECLKNS
jgi:TatD DNase family protein